MSCDETRLLTRWQASDGSCPGAGYEEAGRPQEVPQSHGDASQWALRLLMLALVGHLAGRIREVFNGSRPLLIPGVGHFPLQCLAAHLCRPLLVMLLVSSSRVQLKLILVESRTMNTCTFCTDLHSYVRYRIGTIHFLKLKQNTWACCIAVSLLVPCILGVVKVWQE